MNPLRWRREHQMAWMAFLHCRRNGGLVFAWMESAARTTANYTLGVDSPSLFLLWLSRRTAQEIRKARRFTRKLRRSTLQPPIALAVVTATLLDPAQATIAIVGLVGIVLIKTGVQPRSSRRFL